MLSSADCVSLITLSSSAPIDKALRSSTAPFGLHPPEHSENVVFWKMPLSHGGLSVVRRIHDLEQQSS